MPCSAVSYNNTFSILIMKHSKIAEGGQSVWEVSEIEIQNGRYRFEDEYKKTNIWYGIQPALLICQIFIFQSCVCLQIQNATSALCTKFHQNWMILHWDITVIQNTGYMQTVLNFHNLRTGSHSCVRMWFYFHLPDGNAVLLHRQVRIPMTCMPQSSLSEGEKEGTINEQ